MVKDFKPFARVDAGCLVHLLKDAKGLVVHNKDFEYNALLTQFTLVNQESLMKKLPQTWYDTQVMARELGIPKTQTSLDKLKEMFLKDLNLTSHNPSDDAYATARLYKHFTTRKREVMNMFKTDPPP